jgi:hypothetical protein
MGQLVDEVKKYSRIALDTNLFIYLLKDIQTMMKKLRKPFI